MLLEKYAVQAIDGRWLVDGKDGTYWWEYERHLRSVFDSEQQIRNILTERMGSGDYDIIRVFVIY